MVATDEVNHARTSEVIIERRGTAGIIRLNRPRALNSLTLPMIRAITAALHDFADDPEVASVVMMGEGERGFCAGGDIRALHESARAGDGLAASFWREEFRLNHMIAAYPKPYVALMDGITMGGGVGLSSHGRHRIVTERTRLAMPETGIGYVPDVGATWLLPRGPGEAGTWLGLTGLDIGAADAIHARLADLQIASSRLGEAIDALSGLPRASSSGDVDAVLQALSEPEGESRLRQNAAMIDRAFRFDTRRGDPGSACRGGRRIRRRDAPGAADAFADQPEARFAAAQSRPQQRLACRMPRPRTRRLPADA